MNENIKFGDNFLNNAEVDHVSKEYQKNKKIPILTTDMIKDYQNWYNKKYSKDDIKLLQKALGLKNADGIVGKGTLEAIFNYEINLGNQKIDGLLTEQIIKTLINKEKEKLTISKDSQKQRSDIQKENGDKKLNSYRIILKNTKESLDSIIKDRDENTDLLMKQIDIVHSIFSDDTASKNYERSFKNTQKTAKDHVQRIQKDIDSGIFNPEQKLEAQEIINNLNKLANSDMKSFSIITGTINYYKNLDDYGKLGIEGAKGMAKGTVESVTAFLTSIFDLTALVFKYITKGSEYRDEINKQVGEIWELVKSVDKKMVESAIIKAVDHINSLPSEQQAYEIGRFGGLVIGFLIPMGAFSKGSKALKVAKARALAPSAKLADKVIEKALSIGLFTLNGPVESLIGAGLSKSLRGTINIIKGSSAANVKITEIDNTIKLLENEISKTKNTAKKAELDKALKSLKGEKTKILSQKAANDEIVLAAANDEVFEVKKVANGYNDKVIEFKEDRKNENFIMLKESPSSNVKNKKSNVASEEVLLQNAKLSDSDRIAAAANSLGLKRLTKEQRIALLKAHKIPQGENVRKGKILMSKGKDGNPIFTREQAQKLMDEGIAGKYEKRSSIIYKDFNNLENLPIENYQDLAKLLKQNKPNSPFSKPQIEKIIKSLENGTISKKDLISKLNIIKGMDKNYDMKFLDDYLENIGKSSTKTDDSVKLIEDKSTKKVENKTNKGVKENKFNIPEEDFKIISRLTEEQKRTILYDIFIKYSKSKKFSKEDLKIFKSKTHPDKVFNFEKNFNDINNLLKKYGLEEDLLKNFRNDLSNPSMTKNNNIKPTISNQYSDYFDREDYSLLAKLLKQNLNEAKVTNNDLVPIINRLENGNPSREDLISGIDYIRSRNKDYDLKFLENHLENIGKSSTKTDDSVKLIEDKSTKKVENKTNKGVKENKFNIPEEDFKIISRLTEEQKRTILYDIFIKYSKSKKFSKEDLKIFKSKTHPDKVFNFEKNFNDINELLKKYELEEDLLKDFRKNNNRNQKSKPNEDSSKNFETNNNENQKSKPNKDSSKDKENSFNIPESPKEIKLTENMKSSRGLKDWFKQNKGDLFKKGMFAIVAIGAINVIVRTENNNIVITDEQGGNLSEANLDQLIATTPAEQIFIRNEIPNSEYLNVILKNYVNDIEKPTISEISSILENSDLRKISGHIYIYAIQSALFILGYSEDLGKIDGWMGPKTKSAIIRFQSENKENLQIPKDDYGILGPITTSAIIQKLKEIS